MSQIKKKITVTIELDEQIAKLFYDMAIKNHRSRKKQIEHVLLKNLEEILKNDK